jgi:hypothetical protein
MQASRKEGISESIFVLCSLVLLMVRSLWSPRTEDIEGWRKERKANFIALGL